MFARSLQVLLLAVVAGVSVTTLPAQSHETAKALEVQGQVSVVRGGQVALFQNNTVGAKELIITGPDGHAVFQISDGSTFEVFPNSRVTFRNTFSVYDFLDLVLGKIRVQIEHRNGPNPKKVSTPTAVISVRGTVFDVSVEDIDGTTLVSVEEGLVAVNHRLQPNSEPKLIKQDEWFRVYPNQPFAKVGGPSPGAIRFVMDKIKGAVADIIVNNPGGVGLPGGGVSGGPQADGGKNKKPPPAGTPPGTPPPPPPGGGN